jgi:hypothetical protein
MKKLNMLSYLFYFNIIFLPFHIINLQSYLRFYKVNKSEGALGKGLHEAIIQLTKKVLYVEHCSPIYRGTYNFV